MSDYEKPNISELNQRLNGGWDVYQHYMAELGYGTIRPYKKYKSPYRTEKHGSFQIYRHRATGHYWSTDFVDKSCNHWGFVQRLFGITDFWEAVAKVRRDIFGEVGGIAVQTYNRVLYEPLKLGPATRSEVTLLPERRAWVDFDYRFWEQFDAGPLFGATDTMLHELERLHLYPAASVQLTTDEKQVTIRERAGDPMYYAAFEEGKRLKCYRPLTKDRKYKFGPANVDADKDLFGFHLLPARVKTLFITAGQKDTAAFRRLTSGLPCFAFNSENAKVPEWVPTFLASIAENVYTVLNNDSGKAIDTGQKGTDYLRDTFGWQDARQPLLDYQVNDVADLVHGLKNIQAWEHLHAVRNYYLNL